MEGGDSGADCSLRPTTNLVVLVEPLEVGGDDGDGEGEHQHPRHRAHAAEQLAQARPAIDIGLLAGS